MSKLDFYVGAKIVCINDDWKNKELRDGDESYPKLGEVYTISVVDSWHVDNELTFLLEEIKNPADAETGLEIRFFSWHFAPVKTTDISCFTQILVNMPKVKELETM